MKPQSNAERFIVAFASIEKSLNRITRRPQYVPFRLNARISARYNAVVRNHLEELCTFAELRNCIVHFRDDHMEIVAEPSDAITENVERIAQLMCKDQKVLSFTTSPVIVCQIDETITDVAIRMDQHQTDRIPVYSGKNSWAC